MRLGCSLAAAIGLAACSSPTSPSHPPVMVPDVLAGLSVDAAVGIAANAGHAALLIRAWSTTGHPIVNLPVHLSSSAGTLAPAQVTTDAEGRAASLLSGPAGSIVVTATGGTLHAETRVAMQAVLPPAPFDPSAPPAPTPDPFFVTLSAWSTSTGVNTYNECMGWSTNCTTFPLAVPVRFHAYPIPANTPIRAVHFDFGDGQSSDVSVGDAFHQYAYDSGGGLRTIGIRMIAADGRVAVSQVQITLSPTP